VHPILLRCCVGRQVRPILTDYAGAPLGAGWRGGVSSNERSGGLDHLNIVQCRGAFIKASLHAARCGVSAQALTQQPPLPHPVQDLVFNIVMEYCAHGELAHFISARQQPLGESEVMFFFVQIIMALHHVHSRNVMHRDLKPQNVFIAEGGAAKPMCLSCGCRKHPEAGRLWHQPPAAGHPGPGAHHGGHALLPGARDHRGAPLLHQGGKAGEAPWALLRAVGHAAVPCNGSHATCSSQAFARLQCPVRADNSMATLLQSDMWAAGCLLYELITLQRPFNGNSFPALVRRGHARGQLSRLHCTQS
jgi:serine/threonine protein kinase